MTFSLRGEGHCQTFDGLAVLITTSLRRTHHPGLIPCSDRVFPFPRCISICGVEEYDDPVSRRRDMPHLAERHMTSVSGVNYDVFRLR